ncbi:MAG: cbb3-type cytochrome c oxidase subunit 3 [Pseudomonadota bacterium]
MEIYTLLRAFADSWFLLFMTLFYLGCIAFVFRPGVRKVHGEISQIPLRDDDWPFEKEDAPELKLGCTGTCATCPCALKDTAK